MESAGCFDCHRIGDRGSRVGPDLSDVGARRTPEVLRQALLAPDDEVLPENRSVRVVTRDGVTTEGRLLNQDAFSVQMLSAKDELRTYLKDNLREYSILDKGLMPSAQGKLTDAQLADVLAYLTSLR
jgi:putative heme-binding domain-containing protein